MIRKWRVNKGKSVQASFTISKLGHQGFISPNPKDFEKYCDIMSDELKFRKLFTDPNTIKRYEEFLEND